MKTNQGGGRRINVLTKAQWEKIEQETRKAERDPDPLQQSLDITVPSAPPPKDADES